MYVRGGEQKAAASDSLQRTLCMFKLVSCVGRGSAVGFYSYLCLWGCETCTAGLNCAVRVAMR